MIRIFTLLVLFFMVSAAIVGCGGAGVGSTPGSGNDPTTTSEWDFNPDGTTRLGLWASTGSSTAASVSLEENGQVTITTYTTDLSGSFTATADEDGNFEGSANGIAFSGTVTHEEATVDYYRENSSLIKHQFTCQIVSESGYNQYAGSWTGHYTMSSTDYSIDLTIDDSGMISGTGSIGSDSGSISGYVLNGQVKLVLMGNDLAHTYMLNGAISGSGASASMSGILVGKLVNLNITGSWSASRATE